MWAAGPGLLEGTEDPLGAFLHLLTHQPSHIWSEEVLPIYIYQEQL